MRKAGARAAAAFLVLALGMAGCNLVDSLTPFGIGTRDYASEASGENVNGVWAGKTASGGDVTFQVGSESVTKLLLHHISGDCILSLDATDLTTPIVNGSFTLEKVLGTGGRLVASGTFNSATASSGSYFFEGLPAGVCPTTGTGTFNANKSL